MSEVISNEEKSVVARLTESITTDIIRMAQVVDSESDISAIKAEAQIRVEGHLLDAWQEGYDIGFHDAINPPVDESESEL